MSKEPTKSPMDKLLDNLSDTLTIARKNQEKLTTAIKVLSNLKNNPVDEFNNPLTKEEIETCMNKCKKILGDNS